MPPSSAPIALAHSDRILASLRDWLLDKNSSYLDLLLVAAAVALVVAVVHRWKHPPGKDDETQ